MKALPENLTKEEEIELVLLTRQIFGTSMFVAVDKVDRDKPEIKRYEELMSKKITFLAAKNRVKAQMMWN